MPHWLKCIIAVTQQLLQITFKNYHQWKTTMGYCSQTTVIGHDVGMRFKAFTNLQDKTVYFNAFNRQE